MIALAEAPASSLNGQLAVRELEEKIVSVHNSVICSLNQLLDLKDLGTGFHSTRLAEWALRVAQQLGLPESRFRDLEVAALLHDIGKVGIPDSILKKPGALTDDEYNLMKKHPEYGWAVIRMFDDLKESSRYILHHHEAFNGRGYPAGLRETEIPIGARIVSVIDAFDAMISWRPYRKGLPLDEVLRRLILGSGTQFDPTVVQCFVPMVHSELNHVYEATGMGLTVAV